MRLLKWGLILGLLFGFFVVLIPQFSRFYLIHWLQGKGYVAKVNSLSVDYFRGEFELLGVNIHTKGRQGLQINQLTVKLDLGAWYHDRLVLRNWRSQGLHIELEQTPQGTQISGLDLGVLDELLKAETGVQLQLVYAADTSICRSHTDAQQQVQKQCLNIGNLQLNDTLARRDAKGWQLTSRSPAQLENVYLRDQNRNISLFYLQKAQLRDFVLSSEWSRIAQLQAYGFHLVERSLDEQKAVENPYQTQFGELLLNDVAFKPGVPAQLHIGTLVATSLRQTLHKDRQAVLLATSQLRQFFPVLDSVIRDSSQSLTLAIGKTRLVDGALAWLDDSVTPAAKESVTGVNLDLSAINSLKPQDSVAMTLIAKLSEKGEVQVRGSLRPFVDGADFDLQGHVRSVDLAHYSAYLKDIFNETLASGWLDGTFQTRASFKQFNLYASLKFTELSLTGAGNVSRQAGDMTLGRAFELLRDRNRSVEMQWRQDYDFSTAKEPLKTALASGFKRTLVKMARSDFRSSGALNLTDMALDGNTVLKFEPLRFNPNERELSDDQARRLRDLAAAVKSKPSQRLKLCAVSTGTEWSALYNHGTAIGQGALVAEDQVQYLLDLAALRARSVKAQLGDLGIASYRLEPCEPEVQMGTKVMSYMTVDLL